MLYCIRKKTLDNNLIAFMLTLKSIFLTPLCCLVLPFTDLFYFKPEYANSYEITSLRKTKEKITYNEEIFFYCTVIQPKNRRDQRLPIWIAHDQQKLLFISIL